MVHRNFEQTEDMVINLLEMDARLDSIEEMLVADQDNLLRPAPNLLPIHLQLAQLENFRNEAMHQAKKASAESRNRLSRKFQRLTGVLEAFDEYIIELSRNMLPLARAGHPEIIVKIVKIAEFEGKEDEKVSIGVFSVPSPLIFVRLLLSASSKRQPN
jgi:exocyst complex component 3